MEIIQLVKLPKYVMLVEERFNIMIEKELFNLLKSVKEEEDGDSSGKDSDDESEEDAEVTEASAGKIGVLLSDDDEDAKIDSE